MSKFDESPYKRIETSLQHIAQLLGAINNKRNKHFHYLTTRQHHIIANSIEMFYSMIRLFNEEIELAIEKQSANIALLDDNKNGYGMLKPQQRCVKMIHLIEISKRFNAIFDG